VNFLDKKKTQVKDKINKMGVGGTLEYISELIGNGGSHSYGKRKKKKQFQTVELKVRMDCDGCVLKIKNSLSSLKGN